MSKHQMLYLALAILAVVIVILLIVTAVRKRRSAQLRNQFGPEYDRTLETAGSRRNAEAELASRAERRRSFEVKPLDAASEERYRQQWQGVQAGFVDAPAQSVRQADALVTQLMTERGYPMAEFDQRSADVSVDHPEVAENYRLAHAISRANDDNKATTEDLRQAMTHYRSLFERLLDAGHGTSGGEGRRDTADLRQGGEESGQPRPRDGARE
ncbi:MAG: hypothetical protein NVSMB29_17510 [Candidatus Dormibacteria bacterium]